MLGNQWHSFAISLRQSCLFIWLLTKIPKSQKTSETSGGSSHTQEPLACCGRVAELSKKLRSSWPSKSKNYLQNISKQRIRHPITLSFDSWANLTVFSLHLANHVLTFSESYIHAAPLFTAYLLYRQHHHGIWVWVQCRRGHPDSAI